MSRARPRPTIGIIIDEAAGLGYVGRHRERLSTTHATKAENMPTATVAKGFARLRTVLPLRLYWRDLYRLADGRVVEVAQIWSTRARWARLEESKDTGPSGWQTQEIGPFVHACKVTF